jgi:hypothetical protein
MNTIGTGHEMGGRAHLLGSREVQFAQDIHPTAPEQLARVRQAGGCLAPYNLHHGAFRGFEQHRHGDLFHV